jgi:hypothetical protein
MPAKSQKLRLMGDVLDKLLVDKNDIPLGRADGILLDLNGEHAPPRVVGIEVGLPTLMERLGGPWPGLIRRLCRALGLRWKRSTRISWGQVLEIGKEIRLNLRAENSTTLAREHWLRDHLIGRIPGNGMKESTK